MNLGLSKQEKIYEEATMMVLKYLSNQRDFQDKKKDLIDKTLKELAERFVIYMNQQDIVGDIVLIKSQKYIDFLCEKFIPEYYEGILEVSQLFFSTLEYSGFLTRSNSAKLFEKLIKHRNKGLGRELANKKIEVEKFSDFSYLDVMDEHLESVIKDEIEKVHKNNPLLENAWKELLNLFSMIDFVGMQIPNVSVVKYGSSQTQFQTASSDVDMTLLTNCYVDERNLLKGIRDYFEEFRKRKLFDGEIRLVDKVEVRIPNLELKFKNFQFDLTINNIFGIINTQLLDVYSLIDDRCRKLGILVKLWAKTNEICSGKHFLSSYGYLMLVINFLQVLEKPVVPSIQKMADNTKTIEVKRVLENHIEDKQVVDIAFVKDVQKIKANFEDYKTNKCSLSALFLAFLNWLQVLANERTALHSIKNACLFPRKEKFELAPDDAMRNSKNFVFSIEDPFDQSHDVGRNFRASTKNDYEDKNSRERYEQFMSAVSGTSRRLKRFGEKGGVGVDVKNNFRKKENNMFL